MTEPRTLNIVSCKLVYTGQGTNGEYRIYEVEATTADGTLVAVPLRSFDELPPGTGTFLVEPYTNKRNETTYTLKRPRGAQTQDLQRRLEALEARVQALELRAPADQQSLSGTPGPAADAGVWS